jgi:hypothetical protein
MEITWNVVRSHAVFFGMFAGTWFVGFIILIPLMTILDDNESLQKALGISITAALAIAGLAVYFATLYRVLNVSLYPFLLYSITPILTALVLIYWFLKNLRLGW